MTHNPLDDLNLSVDLAVSPRSNDLLGPYT